MNEYELLLILKNEGEETIGKIQSYVTTFGGKVTLQSKWGKKGFSYPIKKQTSGFYLDWQIQLTSEKVADLKHKLEYDEEVLRYLFVTAEKIKKTPVQPVVKKVEEEMAAPLAI